MRSKPFRDGGLKPELYAAVGLNLMTTLVGRITGSSYLVAKCGDRLGYGGSCDCGYVDQSGYGRRATLVDLCFKHMLVWHRDRL